MAGALTIVYRSKYRIAGGVLQSTQLPEIFAVRILLFWLRRGRSGNTLENLVEEGE
jgi:hypothetical protein